jgi:hypothetical protein
LIDRRHNEAEGAQTILGHPIEWLPGQSRGGSCAGPTATFANPSDSKSAVGPIARLRVGHRGHPLRSGSPNAAPSYRSRQIARLLATLNLLLDRNSHDFSILDL